MTGPATDAAPDGGGVLHYVLTPEDAVEWERISPRIRRRNRVALGAALFAGIGLVKVIGSNLPDLRLLHSIPMAFAVIALPMLAVFWMQRRDARRQAGLRVPEPVGVVLDHSPQRIVERREGRATPLAFGAAALREVLEGPRHIFLSNGSDVVIIPFRAFAGEAERSDFLRHWRAQID